MGWKTTLVQGLAVKNVCSCKKKHGVEATRSSAKGTRFRHIDNESWFTKLTKQPVLQHLFPAIRFHFCCLANLWPDRMRKWTCCCITRLFFLQACGRMSPTFWLSCVLAHTSLCWWHCGSPVPEHDFLDSRFVRKFNRLFWILHLSVRVPQTNVKFKTDRWCVWLGWTVC